MITACNLEFIKYKYLIPRLSIQKNVNPLQNDKNKSCNSWKQIRLNDAKRKNVFVFCISMSKYIEAYPECDAAKNFRLKMIHHRIMNSTI